MVIKGNPRGSPGGLAGHLQRTDTNERMEVKELRGVVAQDLDGALREMDAHGAALRTTRTLYHASINTRADERLTDEQRTHAIDQLEAKLDLTGQARAVVVHEKEGREHCHVVWARTDLDHMRAIRCDHNYRKHEEVARALEQEFGHARVQGAHVGREGAARPERTPSHAEMQQAERTKLTPQEAREQITAIWQRTDSGKAFAAALEESGWTLARGDKRDFVVLDPHGETHSLARRVDGAKAKDVRERMADLDGATLPTVDQARDLQRAHQAARAERGAESGAEREISEPASVPAPSAEIDQKGGYRDTAVPESTHHEPIQSDGFSRTDVGPAEAQLPAFAGTGSAESGQPEIPLAATPEPEAIALAPIAAELILEPDLSRGNAAEAGDAAAGRTDDPPPLASEPSEHVASRDAPGDQAIELDSRADEPATAEGASLSAEPSVVEEAPAENFNLADAVEHGAIMVLDVAAGAAEKLVDFVGDFLFGDASPPRPPPSPVEQIRAQRRDMAALEKIAESLRQGSTVEAGSIRALTPNHLQQIMQGGDEVLRSLASDVRTDRDLERDHDRGRTRER